MISPTGLLRWGDAVDARVVLREILRRVELETTTARGERRRLKHVIFVPHRGARIRVRSRRAVTDSVEDAAVACPVNGSTTA